jgi:hypothetical protein
MNQGNRKVLFINKPGIKNIKQMFFKGNNVQHNVLLLKRKRGRVEERERRDEERRGKILLIFPPLYLANRTEMGRI